MKNIHKNAVIDIFTYNITYLRKSNNLSLKEMSEILNISIYSIKKLEKGILPTMLKVDILFKIQNYFGIAPQVIIDKRLNKK